MPMAHAHQVTTRSCLLFFLFCKKKISISVAVIRHSEDMTKVDVNIRRNGQLRVSLGDMELAFSVEVEEKEKVSVL